MQKPCSLLRRPGSDDSEYPVRRAIPLPPRSSLQWNHSVLLEPDFKAPWQALKNAFDLHQELHPGDFDNSWIGELGLPPPRLRQCQSLKVQFHDQIIVHFGDNNEPIGGRDAILISTSSPAASNSCTDAIAQWMNRKVVSSDADPLSQAVCISGGQALVPRQPACQNRSQINPSYELCHSELPHLEVATTRADDLVCAPFSTCSIMGAFIQLARLPADDDAYHAPDPGGQPPAGRVPDFTNNMLARIDPALFPAVNLDTFGLTVRTWHIHHVHHVPHVEPRLLHLEGDRTTWADQLRAAWHGLWNPGEPTAFTLPTPMPARSPAEQFITLDIILSQGLQKLRYSGLVSVHLIDEGDGMSQRTIAASFGPHVSGNSNC